MYDNPLVSVIIKGNSASSNHYFTEKDKHLLRIICHTSTPTTAILLNRDTITTNIEGNISIPTLSKQATNTNIFPKINYSLFSLDNYVMTILLSL